MLILVVLSD